MSCCDTTQLISVDQAKELILSHARPLQRTATDPITECLNRILATEIHAAVDAPTFDNSAVGGYAVSLIAHESVISTNYRSLSEFPLAPCWQQQRQHE